MKRSLRSCVIAGLLAGVLLPAMAMAQSSEVGCFVYIFSGLGNPTSAPVGIAQATGGQVKGTWQFARTSFPSPLSGSYVPGTTFTTTTLLQQDRVATFRYVDTRNACIFTEPLRGASKGALGKPCVSARYSVYEFGSYRTYCNDGATAASSGQSMSVSCSFEGLDAGSGYLRGTVDAANARSALTGHICVLNTGCLEYTAQLAASYSAQNVSIPVPNGTAINYAFSEALSDANGLERVRLYTATDATFLPKKLFCAVSGASSGGAQGTSGGIDDGGAGGSKGSGWMSGGGAPVEPGSGAGFGKGIGR
jgi:hypothetical protein